MKKIFILVLFFIVGQKSFCAPVFASCTTEYPSTSFRIETVDNIITVKVINHNGQGYAPFWNSIVVPNDFTILKEKSDLILKLDQITTAHFKSANCKWYGDKKFACIGSDEKIPANGVILAPWALYSNQIKESSFAGDYEYIEMTLSFYVDQKQHQLVMRYPKTVCDLADHQLDQATK